MAVSGSTRPLDNLPGPQQDGWPSLGWPSVQKDMVYRLLEPKVGGPCRAVEYRHLRI